MSLSANETEAGKISLQLLLLLQGTTGPVTECWDLRVGYIPVAGRLDRQRHSAPDTTTVRQVEVPLSWEYFSRAGGAEGPEGLLVTRSLGRPNHCWRRLSRVVGGL